jgi:hypothetical protein
MRIFNLILLLLALILPRQSQGQSVKISGSGNGYAGTELRIYVQSYPVSKSLVPATRVTCDQEGRFSFELKVKGTETVIMEAGIFQIFFYATSGNEYQIKLPDLITKTAEEEQNSFFIPARIMPEVTNRHSDINNLLKRFDEEFNPVFNTIADRIMYNVKLNDIPALIEKLNRLSGVEGSTDFYRDFVTYRLIMLNRVARGEYPGRKEDSILINRRFASENPAYIDLLEQLFTGYFKDILAGSSRKSFEKAIASSSVKDIAVILLNDGKVSNKELIEFIIILNLYSAFYDGTIPAENINEMFSFISIEGSSEFIKNLAAVTGERVSMLSVATRPPDFRLKDSDGREYSPGNFAGKYLLISFARTDNTFSVAEYGMMNSWLQNYSDRIRVVTILRDGDFEKAVSKMSQFGFSWLMLDGSSADMLEYLYDIKIYPSFLLVDPEGMIVMRNCPFPSENLESVVKKLTTDQE